VILSANAATAVRFVAQIMQRAGREAASVNWQADSRAVKPGDVFLAMPGAKHDGRSHLASAQTAGARATLWDNTNYVWPNDLTLPHCPVPNLKQEIGSIAAALLAYPTDPMQVFAFTGTSGKTSCTTWTAQVLGMLGEPCAVIGTRGAGLPEQLTPFGLTTPQAWDLQPWFAQFAKQNINACAIEASSIGLMEGRLNGTSIKTALFTNLSQDHLDYHGDMAQYAAAKARLFTWPTLQQVVLNADDPASLIMLEQTAVNVDVIALAVNVAIDVRAPLPLAQLKERALARGNKVRSLWANQIKYSNDSVSFELSGDFGVAKVQWAIPGEFNIANALMVTACALLRGHPINLIANALGRLQPVQGRMQAVGGQGKPLVVIDYAHKPAALEQVLASLRGQALARGGQLWCVFGCGGDRDASKRPLMGAIAQRLADHVIVTSDNPRSEAPQEIAAQISAGFTNHLPVRPQLQLDRQVAIAYALEQAAATDVILIAGKGHEAYQEVQSLKLPFSDVEQGMAALALARHWGQA
jgi:UDP-N-acetylmuramoyl-L-alanyl-D-glutamate--2,6-diaminopimelate ligase